MASIWKIDESHSAVEFVVKHMMVSKTKGRFTKFDGTINLDEENLANSSAKVEIDVASIDTHDEKRDAHLRSADFFDAEQFPTITFVSTEVLPRGRDTFQLIGDLTIKGVAQKVVIEVEATGIGTSPWGQQVAGFEAKTDIDRKDYGLTWNVALETGGFLVGDNIKINLEVEAVQQAAAEAEAA
jgi:polyisoprenoid-binding protein YceI